MSLLRSGMPWKLIWRLNETVPGEPFTCYVQSRYHFMPLFFKFPRPDSFALTSLRVGALEQFVMPMPPMPCEVLQGVPLRLQAVPQGLSVSIEAINESERPADFLAELHGAVIVDEGETPLASSWEGPSEVVNQKGPALVANEPAPPNCRACSRSYMDPDSGLICGHPDAGLFGLTIYREPLSHCGWKKFEQHPGRNPDGTLKEGG